MKIEVASISHLKEIKALTESCAVELEKNQIFQWNEHYPSLKKLQDDIEKGELYVLKEKSRILGIIVLTDFMDEEYLSTKWLSQNGKNLYIHRLAIHPEMWGKGYGQRLMDFAEYFARENSYISVRLDTFSQNKRNQEFYENRGYHKLGDIFFPKQSEYSFHCYELIL